MLKYYRNCDELPIYNFYKVLERRNYAYLYLDYDEYNEISIDKNIPEVWEKIYEEYLKLVGDNTMLIYYELINDLLYLETRYAIASTLLQQISMGRMTESTLLAYVLELKRWGYRINLDRPLEQELRLAIKQLKGSENKIRLKKEEKKQLEKRGSKDKMSLIEQVVKLEQALSRNEIDTKKTVVSKWIALVKEVKVINEQRKKQNGK